MIRAESPQIRCLRVALAACVIVLSCLAQNACAQSLPERRLPQTSPAQLPLNRVNSRDPNPNLPGDPGQVGGNNVLKPMTIEQQKQEAQKKSELVDLQKEAYDHAVENLLEAVD
jgi:hypothetical protein